jgi:hypothetical protein
MATLDEIRAKLKAMDNRNNNSQKFTGTSINYPFWKVEEGQTAVVRFLPDRDDSNVFFWRERQLINLPFPGVKGGEEHRPTSVRVPCVEMWGDSCPILAQVRPWWNDKSLEDMARQYWKKRSYLFQALVIEDPLNEKYENENPIRRLIIGPQIFNIVKDALMDPDLESNPIDFVNGLDFRITVTKKGQYRDYSTSKWARRETALSEEHLAAIEKNGLFDLNDWMPAKPSQDHLAAMVEMFEASVNGELYDPEKWGRFYKPFGLELDTGNDTDEDDVPRAAKPAPAPAAPAPQPAPAVEAKEEVKEEAAKPAASSAQDILAKIRNRAPS